MSKKWVFTAVAGLMILASAGVYWKVLSLRQPTVPAPLINTVITDKNTVAHTWQRDNISSENGGSGNEKQQADQSPQDLSSSNVEELPYDVVLIDDILQQIRLDQNGKVLVDRAARKALDEAYLKLGADVGSFEISQLQDLIRVGWPGTAGEQMAEIFAQYYDYRLAEEDFLAETQEVTAEDAEKNYEQLVQMRRSYLGHEVAEKLYVEEEIQSRHMFASMSILRDSSLSEEQKRQGQAQLQQELNQQLSSLNLLDEELALEERVSYLRQQGASEAEIYSARAEIVGAQQAQALADADREEAQWQRRFNQFWQEREQIVVAGLSEADQQQQIELLLSGHFSEDEIERARNSQLSVDE